jgi:hypothetical protein
VNQLTKKACTICSTPTVVKTYDKCVARLVDGSILNSTVVGNNTALVFLPKGKSRVAIAVHNRRKF